MDDADVFDYSKELGMGSNHGDDDGNPLQGELEELGRRILFLFVLKTSDLILFLPMAGVENT